MLTQSSPRPLMFPGVHLIIIVSGWAVKKKNDGKRCATLFKANYAGGNLTDTLTFRYAVAEGDYTDIFDVLDTRTTRRQRFSTALVRPAAAEVSI